MVVFTGCPLRCPIATTRCYRRRTPGRSSCYRVWVVSEVKGLQRLPCQDWGCYILCKLTLKMHHTANSKPFVDAFVLSGGEPLQQLEAIAGSRPGQEPASWPRAWDRMLPGRLETLLAKGLLDRYFSMSRQIFLNRITKGYQRGGMAARQRKQKVY